MIYSAASPIIHLIGSLIFDVLTPKIIQLKTTYRYFFLILISLLLIRELFMGVLMGDVSALLEASIYVILLYFLISNHEQTKVALLSWAAIYLIVLTGIKAGAKSLVILGGNGWEINSTRYQMDLFLVGLGLFIILFRKYLFKKNLINEN